MKRNILQDNFMQQALGAEMFAHVRAAEQAQEDAQAFARKLKRIRAEIKAGIYRGGDDE
jgi:hypothetical protein